MRRDIMVMAMDRPRPTTAAITVVTAVATAAATAMVTHRLTMAADTGPTTAGRMSAACIVRTLTIRVLGTTVATGTAGDRVAGDRVYERAAERGGPLLELYTRAGSRFRAPRLNRHDALNEDQPTIERSLPHFQRLGVFR